MNKHIILAGAAAALIALIAEGCNNTTNVTEYDASGKIVKQTVTASVSPLTDKAIVGGGGFSAVKVETIGSASTQTPALNVAVGGGAGGVASVPTGKKIRVIGLSWSSGILNSLSNSSASSGDLRYIGDEGETAEDTVKCLKAALQLKAAK